MIRLIAAANRRFLLRHPWQLGLAILGITIGVAAAVAVALVVDSARRSFDGTMAALLGPTTHQIVSADRGIPESLVHALRAAFPTGMFSPVIDRTVEAGSEQRVLRLYGIDLVAGVQIRGRAFRGLPAALPELLTRPDSVLLARRTGTDLGLAPGDRLSLPGRAASVTVLGFLEGDAPADPAIDGLLLADIATAQEILGRYGVLDRIDTVLPEDPDAVTSLAARLPPGLRVVPAEGRTEAVRRLSRAFETNLQAMSLLGLVVGLFLIHSTMTFAVVQRRDLLAVLRLLGVTRRELLSEVLIESLGVGLVGTVLGLAAGVAIADFLSYQVYRTINDMYFTLPGRQLLIAPAVLLRGLVFGLGVSILGALLPALEASGTRPLQSRLRSNLEDRVHAWAPRAAMAGIAVLAVAAVLILWPGSSLLASIMGLFLVMLGYGLFVPGLLRVFAKPARHIRAPILRLGVVDVLQSLSRTGVGIAALTIAFGAAIGVGAMTDSFRLTVAEWLDQIMQSDLYVSSTGSTGSRDAYLPAALLDQIGAMPEVTGVSAVRAEQIESSLGQVDLVALMPVDWQRSPYRIKSGELAWPRFAQGEGMLVSESFASRHGLSVGDRITLYTKAGQAPIEVAGVFFDYRSDRGVAMISLPLFRRLWSGDEVSSIGVVLKPGISAVSVRKDIEALPLSSGRVAVRSTGEIREASLAMFDRTFAITRILRLLAVGVALSGLVGSLLALQLERTREYAILRALAVTPMQLRLIVLSQCAFVGIAAGLLALPLGA